MNIYLNVVTVKTPKKVVILVTKVIDLILGHIS